MVEIPKWATALSDVTKHRCGEVRSLEVLGPFGLHVVNAGVECLQRLDLWLGQLLADDDDEIDVTVLVEVTDGKGALEVGTDERVA